MMMIIMTTTTTMVVVVIIFGTLGNKTQDATTVNMILTTTMRTTITRK